MNWITETKRIVAGFKKRFEPMTYVLPAEDSRCFRCGFSIENRRECIHDMDSGGFIKVYCSDGCFYQVDK